MNKGYYCTTFEQTTYYYILFLSITPFPNYILDKPKQKKMATEENKTNCFKIIVHSFIEYPNVPK